MWPLGSENEVEDFNTSVLLPLGLAPLKRNGTARTVLHLTAYRESKALCISIREEAMTDLSVAIRFDVLVRVSALITKP